MQLNKILFLVLVFSNTSFAQLAFKEVGMASYYSDKFHGKRTASGEKFDMHSFTSAHRNLPFNTLIKVTNIKNGKSVIVRVNDRGPAKKTRVIDISKAAAKKIGLLQSGLAKVKLEILNPDDPESTLNIIDCCYSEMEEIIPLKPFNILGSIETPDGVSIEKTNLCLFNSAYIASNLSKIKISPIFIQPK